ncbi:hypothetical protein B0H15DRAFT_796564 [Mycena belliarum]|uniref:Uncharacterized protein n=1 Tax=Mycena belliarum TaxID=1033014 RepID=A0AAD6UHV4_9AGAR|nr:hypothetical protein B0H15DRAFT_796564 [Mycena belliae]
MLSATRPPSRPPLSTTRIIVSSNAEQYRVVEITGARSGASIRERIFSKAGSHNLSIPDDRQSCFSVYQSEVGVYAIGGALTDSRLFELCQELGDASGSLKFFVSTAPDRPPQYEPNYPEYPVQYRPVLYNGSGPECCLGGRSEDQDVLPGRSCSAYLAPMMSACLLTIAPVDGMDNNAVHQINGLSTARESKIVARLMPMDLLARSPVSDLIPRSRAGVSVETTWIKFLNRRSSTWSVGGTRTAMRVAASVHATANAGVRAG